jgi:hypothetical protein
MTTPIPLQDQLLKASLLCGMKPSEGAAYRLQLFFVANTILESKSRQSDFQRALETGVDQSGYWENHEHRGSGNYILTKSGFNAAIQKFGNIDPIYVPTEKSDYHILIEGSIDDLSLRMETLGASTKVYINGEKTRSAKVACKEIEQLKGISLPTFGESAVRVLYNFAVERGLSLTWKGKIYKKQILGTFQEPVHELEIENTSEPEETPRQSVTIDRIIRDTAISRRIKDLHESKCQICGKTIPLGGNKYYAEAHHIKPLGKPHHGPDVAENIVCLCPEHHVLLDYGIIKLDLKTIKNVGSHRISDKYIDYHNDVLFSKRYS